MIFFFSSNSGIVPSIMSKDFEIIEWNNKEEEKIENEDEYFNYASFEIEKDITNKIKEYFNPNISDINNPSKNKYGYFDNYKDEHKFKKPRIIREVKPKDLYKESYKEYYEDLKLKINRVKNGEKILKQFNPEEDKIKENKKSESQKELPKILLSKNKGAQSLTSTIYEEHFK